MFLVKKSRTFNEQKQNLKYFQGLKIRVLKFKGFQDGCKPCLKKNTYSHIVKAECPHKLTTSWVLF